VAQHTTFHGTVQVAFPAVTAGALPITGSLQDVTLDFKPANPAKHRLATQTEEGERVATMLGLRISPDRISSGGLLISEVADGSSAQQGGIQRGDLLLSLDGWTLLDRSDLLPTGKQRFAVFGVVRSGEPGPMERHVSIQGYKPGAASELLWVGVLLGTAAAIVLFFASPLARGLTWLDRWASRAALAGAGRRSLIVWLMSCLVAFWRGDAAHAGSDALPYVVFLLASGLCSLLPFTHHIISLEPDAGTLLLLPLLLASVVAIGAGQHPQSRVRAFGRGLALAGWTALFHVPTILATACVVLQSGSLMLHDIVRSQGGEPWHWHAVRTPAGPLTLLLFFAPVLLDRSAVPSLIPDAEPSALSNWASPRPRGGLGSALWWGSVFVLCGLAAALFLGGWAVPFLDRAMQTRVFALQALGAVLFLLKAWLLALGVAVARETLPRLRIDLGTSALGRWFIPMGIACMTMTAGWIWWEPSVVARKAVGATCCVLVALLVTHVARRLGGVVRAAGAQPHVSPFL
jgi:NADH-quinone oxidoreductase subunit H